MKVMRAKLRVSNVIRGDGFETLIMTAVCKSDSYPEDGTDENNTFAKFTPSADLTMCVNNSELHGKFEIGQEFYVDFFRACK